jgi:hypothetical protein
MQQGNEAQNVDFVGKLTDFREEGGNEGVGTELTEPNGI